MLGCRRSGSLICEVPSGFHWMRDRNRASSTGRDARATIFQTGQTCNDHFLRAMCRMVRLCLVTRPFARVSWSRRISANNRSRFSGGIRR